MGKRRKARESTLQILFQLEFNDSQPDVPLGYDGDGGKAGKDRLDDVLSLVRGVVSHREAIDDAIQSVSEHWRLPRMVPVDRNILRIAAYEMMFGENLAPAIIINEAIEIAKKYSGERSAVFINGVLDALAKELRAEERR